MTLRYNIRQIMKIYIISYIVRFFMPNYIFSYHSKKRIIQLLFVVVYIITDLPCRFPLIHIVPIIIINSYPISNNIF